MAFISYFFYLLALVIIHSSAKSDSNFNNNEFKQRLPKLGMSWKNCGPRNDPVQLLSLVVSPEPVPIPGNFTVALTLNSSRESSSPISATILVERKVGPFFVKVPCLENIGSCSYADMCGEWAKFCPKYLEKYGFTCTCPMPPKSFVIQDAPFSVTSVIPPEFLGDYRVTADISTKEGHATCIQIELAVKSGK